MRHPNKTKGVGNLLYLIRGKQMSVQYYRPLKILSIRTHYVKLHHQLCATSSVTIFLFGSQN